ncbi:MAG: nitrogenase cofactor biosynthesis protein NifB [Magnetococcales bacterium]|nr:nitrogenase cofactor biosynthesis protein NifB [Magnetococcales bacterium]MBF0149050.1 nitrogenase cofactor biosynthesis protein NifB [Magnetococcales bacterium]MBF0632619.1 nitrogenase cofactor biosynthesis protein NifB [Magnetococcales bacterium]
MPLCASSDRQRTTQHPCYTPEAREHHARLHLAVAPACNIQCHYCNRKYDCTNESRPGVVSELLTPEQALARVEAVRKRLPNLTVVGIAGPGDALANPERLWTTCRGIRERFADLTLCLSTNGLALPEQVGQIQKLGIHHVTITMNTLDPTVAANIYPWIFWDHRRLKGVEATRILIANQLAGLDALVAAGVLVKVNSVLIPGVNHDHLAELNLEISHRGAFLHNIMPMISDPAHGTYYGLMGYRGPDEAQLQAVRDGCAGEVTQMTHCRQCRADAIGLLDEDQGPTLEREWMHGHGKIISIHPHTMETEATDTLRIAVASQTGSHVDQHFGHARVFTLYDVHDGDVRQVGMVETDRYCHGDDACGDNDSLLERALRALEGCDAVLCERIGFSPWQALETAGIQPVNRYAGIEITLALKQYWATTRQRHPRQKRIRRAV